MHMRAHIHAHVAVAASNALGKKMAEESTDTVSLHGKMLHQETSMQHDPHYLVRLTHVHSAPAYQK